MNAFMWIGFFTSLAAILVIARRNVALALAAGAVVLALFTLPPLQFPGLAWRAVTDPSVIALAVAVGFIPLIGGLLREGGLMDDLVNNLRIGKRGIMTISPAILGLLPMPGGALFSAPILDRCGRDEPSDLKVAVNIWFRHLLILIYPLSSDLIATAAIAALNLYTAILYLLPSFALATALGVIFYARRIKGRMTYDRPFSLGRLLLPIAVILLAPILDFTLKLVLRLPVKEIATVAGVVCAFVAAACLSPRRVDLAGVIRRSRFWNFSLIIFGLFLFLKVFQASNLTGLIASLPIPLLLLCEIAGFVIAFAAGRVLLPASVVFPIYLAARPVTPIVFGLIYTSVFFGYVMSPTHPCMSFTCEYFDAPFKDVARLLAPLVAVIMAAVLAVSAFLL